MPFLEESAVSTFKGTIADLRKDGRGIILFAIAGGWFLSMGARMMYPVLLPHFRLAYDLDLSTAGLLLSTLWLAYALGQLPGGILSDRVGEGTVMVASTAISAVTLLLVISAGSRFVIFGATALFGLGTALYGVARFAALSDVFPDRVGTAVGLTAAAGDVANSILPPVAGLIAVAVAWQVSFGLAIPLFVLVAVLLWKICPAQTSGTTSAVDAFSKDILRYILSVLTRPSIVYATAIQTIGISVWQAFTGFYPTYLIEIKGFSPTLASGLFGFFFALGVVIKPLSGSTYDRFGPRRSLFLMFVIVAIALAFIPLLEGFWPIATVTVFASLLLGRGTITLSFITGALPSDMQGTGLGVLRTVYWMIGATSPAIFGALADRGYFDEGFFMMAGLMAFGLLLILKLPKDES